MNKYTKNNGKSNNEIITWHYFVATNKNIVERFRVTKELHVLIEAKAKEANVTKSEYLTNLVLSDCGYKNKVELIEGIDWLLE